MSKIFVTGGLGYIGSHTVIELLHKNYEVVIVDNLYNSSLSVLDAIQEITNKKPEYIQLDVSNYQELFEKLRKYKFDSVIHFAAYKAVGESVKDPLKYYTNNLLGLSNVLRFMKEMKIANILFSSSATVYGSQENFPITEESKLNKPNSPYGVTKLVGEYILEDCAKAYNLKAVALRYFNPIGAHPSGLIGESPNGIPNNLLPYITKVASGELDELNIYGNDYDTKDGTCIRDYVDVCDLADAHVKVIDKIQEIDNKFSTYNIGTNHGTTVLEMVSSFENANGIKIKYKIAPRRDGDVEKMYCDFQKINKDFGWKPRTKLEDSLRNSWKWEKLNHV